MLLACRQCSSRAETLREVTHVCASVSPSASSSCPHPPRLIPSLSFLATYLWHILAELPQAQTEPLEQQVMPWVGKRKLHWEQCPHPPEHHGQEHARCT